MKVILLQKVANLGALGDQVSVKPGFGRNFLIPYGKAVPATADNIAAFEAKRAEYEAKAAAILAAASNRKQGLEGASVTISANASAEGKLFGSVTTADIAHQLEAQGFHIEKRQIELNEPIKTLGVYRVGIRLHADVKPEIKVWIIKQ